MQLDTRTKLFLGALMVITPVFYTTTVLDIALVPRFLYVSVALLFGLFLFLKELIKPKRLTLFDILFFAYFIISAASLLWALNRAEAIFHIQKIFITFLIYFIVRSLLVVVEERGLRWIVICNIVVTFIMIAVFLLQLVDIYDVSDVVIRSRKMSGLSANKNQFASFVYMTLIINLLSMIHFKKTIKILGVVLVLLQLVVLFILQTRAVYMAVAVSGLFLFVTLGFSRYFSPKNMITIGVLMSFLSICLFASIYFSGDNFFDTDKINVSTYIQSSPAQERFAIWEKTIEMIKEQPLHGVGAGNWSTFFPSQNLLGTNALHRTSYQRPHNDFLWVFSEIGLFGFLSYIGMFVVLFLAGFKSLNTITFDKRFAVFILLAGLLGYVIISNFSFPRERIEHQVWLALFFALIFFYTEGYRKGVLKLPSAINNYVLMALIGMFLVFNLVLGYYRYQGEKYLKIVYENSENLSLKKSSLEQGASYFYTIDHVSVPLSWHLGVIANDESDGALALKYFTQAYQISPYNHKVLNDLAGCYGRLGNAEKLEEYLLEAYRINPNYKPSVYNMAIFYFNADEYQKSLDMVNKLPYKKYPEKVEMRKKIRSQMNALGIKERKKK